MCWFKFAQTFFIMNNIEKYKYQFPLSIEDRKNLQKLIGSNIMLILSESRKSVYSVDLKNNITFSSSNKIKLIFTKKTFFFEVQIKSECLGDTWIGYNMYNLAPKIGNQINKYKKEWHNYYHTTNISGFIESIDIYGIKSKIVRIEEFDNTEKKIEVEADLNLMIAFNTNQGHKIAISAISKNTDSTAHVSIFSANSSSDFENWVSSKENQWNEKIFNLKHKIS